MFLNPNCYVKLADGIAAHSSGRSSVMLMDGAYLTAVLEQWIDWVTLLLRRKPGSHWQHS